MSLAPSIHPHVHLALVMNGVQAPLHGLPRIVRVRVGRSGVMSGEGAECPRPGPLSCPSSLGNLSPFTLQTRGGRGMIWAPEPNFRIPCRHLTRSSPGPGAHPQGPAVQSGQGLSGLWKAPTRQGWKDSRDRCGVKSRPGYFPEGSAERRRRRPRGEYCLYRAGDCRGL